MKTLMTTCALTALLLLGACRSAAQAQEERGLPVGETAPSFTLRDQNNEEVELAKLLEENNVALVFYRSADW